MELKPTKFFKKLHGQKTPKHGYWLPWASGIHIKKSGFRRRYSHQIGPNFYGGAGLLDKGDLQKAELVIMEINRQRDFFLQSHISWGGWQVDQGLLGSGVFCSSFPAGEKTCYGPGAIVFSPFPNENCDWSYSVLSPLFHIFHIFDLKSYIWRVAGYHPENLDLELVEAHRRYMV